METWRVVAGVLITLFMGLVGVGLATNYRGVTEWHVRRSAAAAVGRIAANHYAHGGVCRVR
ncbi:hypothetical protein GCM10022379_45890 [Micromonospora maritima]